MGKFKATLIGETDGYTVSREFTEAEPAIKWLQGAGLSDFDDQMARGEVTLEGQIVWTKLRLQTGEQADRDAKSEALKLLAHLGWTSWKGRP